MTQAFSSVGSINSSNFKTSGGTVDIHVTWPSIIQQAPWSVLMCVLAGSSGAKQATEGLSEGLKIIPVTLSILPADVAKASL